MYRLTLIIGVVLAGISLAQRSANAATAELYCQTGTGNNGQPIWSPWSSTTPCPITTSAQSFTPVGGNQYGMTVATATPLTVPASARVAQIIVEGQPVRCTDDGTTTPTASVGTLYNVGGVIMEYQSALSKMKCIQTGATATLDVAYYK